MKSSLGKGLQSLIPKKESKIRDLIKGREIVPLDKSKRESVFNVEIDKIRPNPNQPRKDLDPETLKELADSIREHGILQPLLVSKTEETTDRGRMVEYEIVAGERRWRAAKMAGLPSVPVVIRDSSADEKLELALVENIQRKNLNPIETAMAFKRLNDDFGLKHHEIAKKVGRARTSVSNMIRLLSLPKEVQKAVMDGKLNEGQARAILLAKPVVQMPIFRRILKEKLDVRRAEDLARKVSDVNKARAAGPKNPLFKKIEEDLKQVLGKRVSITKRGDFGHVKVEFTSQEELDQIVYLLSKN